MVFQDLFTVLYAFFTVICKIDIHQVCIIVLTMNTNRMGFILIGFNLAVFGIIVN